MGDGELHARLGQAAALRPGHAQAASGARARSSTLAKPRQRRKGRATVDEESATSFATRFTRSADLRPASPPRPPGAGREVYHARGRSAAHPEAATRHDRCAHTFSAAITIAAIVIVWLGQRVLILV